MTCAAGDTLSRTGKEKGTPLAQNRHLPLQRPVREAPRLPSLNLPAILKSAGIALLSITPFAATTTMDPNPEVQALKADIEDLEADIKELKAKNVKLEADLGATVNPEERVILRRRIAANQSTIAANQSTIAAETELVATLLKSLDAATTTTGNIPRHLSFQILSFPWFEFLNSISYSALTVFWITIITNIL